MANMKACSNNVNVAICAGVVVVLVLLLAEANVSVAVTCNPSQLIICKGSISPNPHPTPACCAKLKEQEPCLCQYLKDPKIAPIIGSPDAKNVAKACGVAIPKC